MLVCYARELKGGFAEYAEEVRCMEVHARYAGIIMNEKSRRVCLMLILFIFQVVKIMVPLLKFYFHDDILSSIL